MPLSNYKGYSLKNRIFIGFLIIGFLSIASSSIVSYMILRSNAQEQSATAQQNLSNSLMASLDYAVSHTQVQSEDLPNVLQNKIYEIADINHHDVILYDLKGKYLISNKETELIKQKTIPIKLINKVLGSEKVTVDEFDPSVQADRTSSYMLLKNNSLEPIAIVYFPLYHDDSAYTDVLNRYLKYILLVNLIIIGLGIWLSWVISRNLTSMLTAFSQKMDTIDLLDKNLSPISYYKNDELNSLVKGYNKMILQIQEQKERMSHIERENAWKEMAKQVAHEVKNPLTPMKLTIQNFERKFDPQDPNIREKVKKMSKMITEQIDLIATVASAFSKFAQLPDKNNETFNLSDEVAKILQIFNDDNVFMHTNRNDIMVDMDRIYLNRIITNLVANAKQAQREDVKPVINVDIEKFQKRIRISVEDNGVGIPPEKFNRIFEPNFTSKNSGMGLGLTMVKRMVEEYDGEISVESTAGKGSKFTILLPSNV